MRRFNYRFAQLLDIRNHRQKIAEGELAEATIQWQVAQAENIETAKAFDEAVRQLECPKSLVLWRLSEAAQHAVNIRLQLEQGIRRAQELEGKRERARERLTTATVNKKVMEKLREKDWNEYQQEELQEQQKMLDELGTNSFMRRLVSDRGR